MITAPELEREILQAYLSTVKESEFSPTEDPLDDDDIWLDIYLESSAGSTLRSKYGELEFTNNIEMYRECVGAGACYLIVSASGPLGEVQFFKKGGVWSSYSDPWFNEPLVEAELVEKVYLEWEEKSSS